MRPSNTGTEKLPIFNRLLIRIALLVILTGNYAFSQNLTLPTYEININQNYLNSMNNDPWSDRRFPATVIYGDENFDCEVRYRGASARNLPKKSWKLFFQNGGPEGIDEINLNSEYRDYSISRNHLSMQLAAWLGLEAPETSHISLKVNDAYHGVYLEIEQVDDNFFDNRELRGFELFKGLTHGSRFGQPLDPNQLTDIYTPQKTFPGCLDTLRKRLAFFQFAKPGTQIEELDRIIDPNNFLKYFALQFCILNKDGMAKNFYIYRRIDNRYMLIPWDCDASFGNNWQGNYVGRENAIVQDLLIANAGLQHLTAFNDYRVIFNSEINSILQEGFNFLQDVTNRTYERIQHDVLLDDMKRCSNELFLEEKNRIIAFMEDRSEYLDSFDGFRRIESEIIEYPEDYFDNQNDSINLIISLESEVDRAWLCLFNSAYNGISLPLSPMEIDSLDGFIYSLRTRNVNMTLPYRYGLMFKLSDHEYFISPAPGWVQSPICPFPMWSINLSEHAPSPGDIEIGNLYFNSISKCYYIEVRNTTDHIVNVSGCRFSVNSGWQKVQLPDSSYLPSNDACYLTNKPDLLPLEINRNNVLTGFCFIPNEGDTLILQTSSGMILSSRVVDNVHELPETIDRVVINEINYHSLNDQDPGDWIELINISARTNISGWTIRDSDDNHSFVFPGGISINRDEYLVVARDLNKFREVFPDIGNVIGSFSFGLDGNYDNIRLYDIENRLVDWVSYSDEDPWANEPDGDGNTLELISPRELNYGPEFWGASHEILGSPGLQNSIFQESNPDHSNYKPNSWNLLSVYPNPVNGMISIEFESSTPGTARFRIYDLQSRSVAEFTKVAPSAGYWVENWNLKNIGNAALPSGLYFLEMQDLHQIPVKKIVILR